ncbi:MAG: hypothetical protein HWE37_17310 [Rhodobacteraceae bacterium]|uniref:hypothetical protein n=1 Tax=Salipiger sp. HF18 TaxID=2721557 RepID=UPI00142D2A8E|nr:hypothetical protein [Salipiger sp. HF18]NIY95969.1 hypothetical protein [Salipiger sp. HF18]NVK61818.1 hypothetical protein [Paracoccaceae bacterium]
MTKPKKRPIIDRRRRTESQMRADARIEAIRDKAAIDARNYQLRRLKAVHDNFDQAVWECEDDRLLQGMFSLFCRVAKVSDARLIADHADCPQSVRDEVDARIEERRRSKTGAIKPDDGEQAEA